MVRSLVIALTVALVASAAEPLAQGPTLVPGYEAGIGRMAPDLAGTDLAGRAVKLSEVAKNNKAVVVAVTSTSCPVSKKYLPTFAKLEKEFAGKGVGFLYVNPIASDQPEDAKAAVKASGIAGTYILDRDVSLALALGAKTTGDVFLLDAKRTVVYRGAVDDQYGVGYSLDSPKRTFLRDAIELTLSGWPVKVPATTAPGCELDLSPAKPHASAAVTYHNRISRIVQTHCCDCHRDGGVAPFSLGTLEDVVSHKGMIKKVVERGTMPPWFASGKAGHPKFVNDSSLSAADKAALLAWFEAGAPAGDVGDAPLPPIVPGEWSLGRPDVIYQIPKPIAIKATGTMPYQMAVVDTKLDEDKWVVGYEIQPTDKAVVHHVLVFVVGPNAKPGTEPDDRDGFFAAYVPGNNRQLLPDGFAKKLLKGSKLKFQIHYTPNGKATTDQVRMGLMFNPNPPKHELRVYGLVNYTFRIPPGAADHAEKAVIRLPHDAVITGFLPHMHMRGKSCKYEATTTAGKTIPLLDIPRYDFNWQLRYQLAEPVRLSRGTSLGFHAVFDNSEANPANPDPKKTVKWGQQSTDEMHLGYVEYYIP